MLYVTDMLYPLYIIGFFNTQRFITSFADLLDIQQLNYIRLYYPFHVYESFPFRNKQITTNRK